MLDDGWTGTKNSKRAILFDCGPAEPGALHVHWLGIAIVSPSDQK